MSINKIKIFLKGKVPLTDKTLYEYAEKIQDTLNIFFVDRFSKKVYERLSWPKKIYVADLGITNILKFSEDIGKRMENAVFLELLRKTNFNPLLRIYYFKEKENEVDFLIKEGLDIKQLIQVTYSSALDEIEKRELRALVKASELLKCKNLLVITWNLEDELEFKGKRIKFLPMWKWLLKL